MSGLALTKEESQLLVAEGWQLIKTSDGPDFYMDFGQRQIRMAPVIMRKLTPMVFRSQARRNDVEYDAIAIDLGWGGARSLPGSRHPAMARTEIAKFDAGFAHELTPILKDYAVNADPQPLIENSIERRKKVRLRINMADLIDYAYLRRSADLEKITLEDTGDGSEFLAEDVPVETLEKAIELSRRP